MASWFAFGSELTIFFLACSVSGQGWLVRCYCSGSNFATPYFLFWLTGLSWFLAWCGTEMQPSHLAELAGELRILEHIGVCQTKICNVNSAFELLDICILKSDNNYRTCFRDLKLKTIRSLSADADIIFL